MKYVKHVDNIGKFFNSSYINISDTETLDDFIEYVNEGIKFKNFLKKSFKLGKEYVYDLPRIKKLMNKAALLRLQAAQIQIDSSRKLVQSMKQNEHVDVNRLKMIFLKKIKLLFDTISKYEHEAKIIAGDNIFLVKVRRVMKMNAEVAYNEMLMKNTSEEEEFELDAENDELKKFIDIDLRDITDTINQAKGTGAGSSDASSYDYKPKETSTGTILDDMEQRIDKKSIPDEKANAMKDRAGLFIKSEMYKYKKEKEGGTVRKSSVADYRVIDKAYEYMQNDKLPWMDAMDKAMEEEGLI